jgi:hypothetical protein
MKLLAEVLVALFFAGLIGSATVVVVTFIEDIKLFFEKDEKATVQKNRKLAQHAKDTRTMVGADIAGEEGRHLQIVSWLCARCW